MGIYLLLTEGLEKRCFVHRYSRHMGGRLRLICFISSLPQPRLEDVEVDERMC